MRLARGLRTGVHETLRLREVAITLVILHGIELDMFQAFKQTRNVFSVDHDTILAAF